jgi:putative flippase GtrA
MGGRARDSGSGGGLNTSASLAQRLWSRNAAVLLARNTAVSILVFLLGLGLLWVLVEYYEVAEVPAAAAGFILANTLHYVLGRTWIYRGTERRVVPGYAYFLINGLVGLAITLALFDAFLRFTAIHYVVARILVSVFAGLAMFLLNATLNFRRL